MSHSSHTILCGSCKRPAESVPNPKPNDNVTCPRCHRSDSFKNVMASIQEHVAHETAKALSASFAKAARGSKFIKVSSQPPRQRTFRWVAGNFHL